ncbi:MAG: ABC transporter permease [Armatimonadota bacterium]|nr:ABC transporter permease [Armatimonadota bacterium]
MRCPDALRRTMAVARAEWLHNWRDPRSLGIIVLLPIMLLLLYAYAINFDLRELRFAVQDWDRSEASAELVDSMVRSDYFTLHGLIDDTSEMQRLVEHGRVRFALVIPSGFAAEIASGRTGRVQVLLDGADSQTAGVALGYMEAVMRRHSVELVRRWVRRAGIPASTAAPPLGVEPRVLYNPEVKSINFVVPGLIAVLMMMLAALLTSGCIVRERESGSFEGLAASPIAPMEIVLGKLTPYAFIGIFDVVLCIVVGWLIFGVAPEGDLRALLGVTAVYLVASLAIGLLVSSLTRTHQLATLLAFLTTMLPTMLLTGFVFPLRSMPRVLQYIAQIFPATHFLVIIRAIYLKGTGIGLFVRETVALVVIALLLVVLAAKAFRKSLE